MSIQETLRAMNKPRNKRLHILLVASLLLFSGGCNNRILKDYELEDLAKSDIDYVSDIAAHEIKTLVERLMVKLYKRNPRELRKVPGETHESRLKKIFSGTADYHYSELNNLIGEDAANLAFDEDFPGDRVFAFIVGLTSMLHASYNNKLEFFILDTLDQQKLYNSARNIEILDWRLTHRRNSQGEFFLLSNSQRGEVQNLSFERLFGKMIAIQDMMGKVTETKTDRTINKVVISVAQTALLPVGL